MPAVTRPLLFCYGDRRACSEPSSRSPARRLSQTPTRQAVFDRAHPPRDLARVLPPRTHPGARHDRSGSLRPPHRLAAPPAAAPRDRHHRRDGRRPRRRRRAARPAATRSTSSSSTSRTASPTARSPARSRCARTSRRCSPSGCGGARRHRGRALLSGSEPGPAGQRPGSDPLVAPCTAASISASSATLTRSAPRACRAGSPRRPAAATPSSPPGGRRAGEQRGAQRRPGPGRPAGAAWAGRPAPRRRPPTASGLLVPITPVGPRLIQPVTYWPRAPACRRRRRTRPAAFGTVPVAASNGSPGIGSRGVADRPDDEPDVEGLLLAGAAHAAVRGQHVRSTTMPVHAVRRRGSAPGCAGTAGGCAGWPVPARRVRPLG